MRFGLNDDLRAFDGDTLRRAQNIGCDTIRVPVGWNVSPAALTASIDTIRDRELRPLICLWYHTSDVPSPESFAAGCQGFAQHFPDAMLQLGNEPQHSEFGNITAHQAGTRIAEAAFSVHEIRPEQKLIAAAPSPAVAGWRAYQREMFAQIPGYLNVDPALHFYPRGEQPIKQLEIDLADARNLGTGKVHITEAGFMRSTYGDEQAELSARALTRADDLDARTMIFHRAVPDPNPNEWERKAKLAVLTNDQLRRALKEARGG